MASGRPRLYTASDRETGRLTTNNESDKARYEWIQRTELRGPAEGGAASQAEHPEKVSQPTGPRGSCGKAATSGARGAGRRAYQGQTGARGRQGRAETARSRSGGTGRSPTRSRKGRGCGKRAGARSRTQGGARCALRRPQEAKIAFRPPPRRRQQRPARLGEPIDAEARCLILLHSVVFLHCIVLFHSIVFLHGVLGHGVLLHRVLGHAVLLHRVLGHGVAFLHAVVLAHLVLGEGGRRKRQAERNSSGRYSERNAGAHGHWLVILVRFESD